MLLAIYLNDHLATAVGARELARRSAKSNRDTSYGPFLETLARELNEDRQALLKVMHALGIRSDPLKVGAGWTAEKVGRLKPNGRLRGYSPLSRVVELEGLTLVVRGNLALWRSLERLELDKTAAAGVQVEQLVARAERQLEGLEAHRLNAVSEAFGSAAA
jgi:hypothetical protein